MRTSILLTMAMFIALLPARSDARGDAEKKQTEKQERAGSHKESTAGKKVRLRGMHARMVKICKLSEEQQSQVAEMNEQRQKAMKEFDAENAEKIKTLKAQIATARENKDKKALKEARPQLRDLLRKRKKIDTQWQAKIMAVLTPEQKVQWDRYQTMLSVMRRFKNAELTDDQKAEVKTAYDKFIKGVDLSDKEARHEALQKLFDYIRAEILTDAQRAATTRPAKKTTTKPAEESEKPAETGGEKE